MGHAFKLRGGSGGSGASLLFSAPAGAVITVSKDGKSKTKTADSSGAAKFTGLSTGVWSWSMRDSTHEATTPANVEITADYYITAAFFAATIAVTYPEGSTCTCTDGTTTLRAVGTTGSYTFTVPNTGEWEVSCTDGSETASETVVIATEGQTVNVELTYEYFLYNLGDECISASGGWDRLYCTGQYGGELTLHKNSDHMIAAGTTQTAYISPLKNGMFGTLSSVDLSRFSVLRADCSVYVHLGPANSFIYLGVGGDIAGTESKFDAKTELIEGNSIALDEWVSKDVFLDISEITGDKKIGFYCKGVTSSNYLLRINKVWLE